MRLSHKTIRPQGRAITISFDGTPIPALEGETIAAALSAAGIVAFRRTASGAPRGLHCGMGACFDCVVTVDGRIGQRACMTKVADGMVVCRRGHAAAGTARRRTGRYPVRGTSVRCAGGRWRAGRAVGRHRRRGGRRRGRACWTSAARPAGSTPSRWPTAMRMPHPTRSSASASDLRERALAAGAHDRDRRARSGAASPRTRSPPWCAGAP